MKKLKCDYCGKKEDILNSTMKVIGKPKWKMKDIELEAYKVKRNDNNPTEKRICNECRGKGKE